MSRVKRYQNPELYEALAAEYVLGTLNGKAKLRFEKLIHERPYIRYAVDIWERRINELGQTVPEEKPPAAVWKGIKSEISSSASSVAHSGALAPSTSWWERLGLWQSATAVMGVLLAVLLVPSQPQNIPMPTYVSVLESSANKPMVVTMGDASKQLVSVRLMEKPVLAAGEELELWAIPKGGGDPVSVGVIGTDSMESQIQLTKPHWKSIMGAERFAITFEEKGRSSSASPSGRMMYEGQCLDFI